VTVTGPKAVFSAYPLFFSPPEPLATPFPSFSGADAPTSSMKPDPFYPGFSVPQAKLSACSDFHAVRTPHPVGVPPFSFLFSNLASQFWTTGVRFFAGCPSFITFCVPFASPLRFFSCFSATCFSITPLYFFLSRILFRDADDVFAGLVEEVFPPFSPPVLSFFFFWCPFLSTVFFFVAPCPGLSVACPEALSFLQGSPFPF